MSGTSTLFRVNVAQNGVGYKAGVTADETPIDAARLAAILAATGGKRPRNVRKATTAEQTAGHAAVIVNHKARARRVSLAVTGEKIVTNGSGSTATDLASVTVDAARAASLANLSPEETALFVSRFPRDGSEAGTPKDAAAVAAVFRKVNALAGAREWSIAGDASETLA